MSSSDAVAPGKKRGFPLFKYEVNVGSAITAFGGVLVNLCLVFWAFDSMHTGYENRITTLESGAKIQHDWLSALSQGFEGYKTQEAQQERTDQDNVATMRHARDDEMADLKSTAATVAVGLQDFETNTNHRLDWLEQAYRAVQDALARIQFDVVPKNQIR